MKIYNPFIERIRKTLIELGVNSDAKILVGVSGGIDSMVLLQVLTELEYTVAAAHVNFQLRGKESDDDADLVRDWSREKFIPFIQQSVDTKKYSLEKKLNTQSAARQIRYQWWEEQLKTGYFDFVATAHHRDDAIETLFMNLLRGTGIKGLTGIPAKRDQFIRPLINVSRADIESYAADNNIPFRTDSSNDSDDYQRNRIRHHLIPVVREFVEDPHSLMVHTLARIKLEWKAWEAAYEAWKSMNILQKDEAYIFTTSEDQYPFLLRWMEEKGIPWPLAFDYITASGTDKSKTLDYNSMRLSRTKDGFHYGRIEVFEPVFIEKPGNYTINGSQFSIELVPGQQFRKEGSPFTAFINKDAVTWPLQIRQVMPGDHFQPLGMEGQTKTLQDFLVNLKLDNFEKRNIRLLLSGDQILWVIGKRLDERAKVSIEDPAEEVYKVVWNSD